MNARREKEFVGGEKRASDKEELAQRLGVPQEAIEKVFRKNTSGIVQTPQGAVRIQKLKPGEKPILPAVRVLWNDDTEKQDFVSFAAAVKELKIHPKTIPNALRAGRDSFVRKSDGKKFTVEIPGEKTRLKSKPLSEEEKKARLEKAKRKEMIVALYEKRTYTAEPKTFKEMVRFLEVLYPEELAKITGKKELTSEEKSPEEKK